MEPKKERNEKSFVWHDMKISTVFGRIYPDRPTGSLHTHFQYEMFIFKSGNGHINTDSGKIKLSRNTLVLIPPSTNHSIVFYDTSTIKGITVKFRYKKINDRRQQNNGQLFTFFDKVMPPQNTFIVLKDKYFGDFCSDFLEENEANPLLASSLIMHMLEGLFLRILRRMSELQNPKEPVPIYSYTTASLSNDAIIGNTIEIFMSEPDCTLEALANYLKMSPRNVQRILKKTYNMSFTEKLAEMRLTTATDLMANSDYSLREIAEKSNYNKYDSFRKAFLASYGISPSEYREKLNSKKAQ